ncbi:hypothetical protein [Roseivirga echinicomitans]|uniref:Uncharacterized protein n=1 Tax=Roseivirga echinicomitans TaxID=296218 RepID=A0A150XUL8_9BACT|nr:hypothetical protein [Roseivirga echinicomitans]KYG82430.1 hypothetical protein AWN68_14305 [Roseivirga echinicomitans]|tara:strand:- start:641 stop:832 length:192 start_codon:yes stop_codon:yes gene_type:complete
MGKSIRIFKSHEESERYMLEQSLKRTPEERILWLLNQIKIMNKFQSNKKEPRGFQLKKKLKEE